MVDVVPAVKVFMFCLLTFFIIIFLINVIKRLKLFYKGVFSKATITKIDSAISYTRHRHTVQQNHHLWITFNFKTGKNKINSATLKYKLDLGLSVGDELEIVMLPSKPETVAFTYNLFSTMIIDILFVILLGFLLFVVLSS